jgi:hypothetical protein
MCKKTVRGKAGKFSGESDILAKIVQRGLRNGGTRI